jgi:hypothetical protein
MYISKLNVTAMKDRVSDLIIADETNGLNQLRAEGADEQSRSY